jgi:hypothetical protein
MPPNYMIQQYLRRARVCKEKAERASDPDIREQWEHAAEAWRSMASASEKNQW